jgi:hypothetical protein
MAAPRSLILAICLALSLLSGQGSAALLSGGFDGFKSDDAGHSIHYWIVMASNDGFLANDGLLGGNCGLAQADDYLFHLAGNGDRGDTPAWAVLQSINLQLAGGTLMNESLANGDSPASLQQSLEPFYCSADSATTRIGMLENATADETAPEMHPAPEPATLTIWGVTALTLAAASCRRQKRAGRNNKRVQAAVKKYLESCHSPSDHFRMLGRYLTTLADDPAFTKQDVEAFYDDVIVALHRRREHAEVA